MRTEWCSSSTARSRYSLCLLDSRRRCQSKEYEHGPIEAQDILVIQPADMRTDFGFRDRCHLVHHQAAWDAQSIALVRLDRKPEPGCVGLVGRERADRDGFSSVETVILKDDDGPCLACIVLAARQRSIRCRVSFMPIHFVSECRYCVDERLILVGAGTCGHGQRLTTRLRAERRRTHVRDPDLDGTQSLLAQPFATLANFHTRRLRLRSRHQAILQNGYM
jgi:hypothetical protein